MKKVLLIGACCGLVACGPKEEKVKEVMPIQTVEAQAGDFNGERSYSFISQPYRTTNLSFRVSGLVYEFKVQSGQFFRKGQVIAEIDNRDFVIRKERTEAIFEQAKNDYARISNLYQKDNISATNYEQAKANYEKAKADYQTAVNELNDTRLTAPFDGYVQQVFIERFQDVKASSPVVSFIDISRIKAEVYLTEDMAGRIKGQPDSVDCRIRFHMTGNRDYEPSEVFLTQSVTENNLSYRYTAIIDNQDYSLLGGMSGSLSLHNSSILYPKTSVFIPQTAVGYTPEKGTFVWQVRDDRTVTQVPVRLGNIEKNNRVEVTAGLKPGDRIAASRISQLSENDPISF